MKRNMFKTLHSVRPPVKKVAVTARMIPGSFHQMQRRTWRFGINRLVGFPIVLA